MTSSSIPFSMVIKQKEQEKDDLEQKKKTREEWKKSKELEEARKAGTVPAVVDETGKDINPHIPQYISSAPWYVGAMGPTLKHQRPQPEKQKSFDRLENYYERGLTGNKANKWRKGACENCGAMGHQKKDCFERPRKIMAKYSNASIASDDVQLPNLALDYDGKRDRWNGFDPTEYKSVVEEHQKVEDFKRQIKAKKLNEGQQIDDEEGDSDDDDKYADNFDMPGTKVDSKQRITVRNLRIREDTAKYLRNLDPNSAYYDPKTRSMRDNPYTDTGKNSDQVDYAGENFVRFSGDTVEQAKAQLFAWEAYEKGVDVSLQAEPTKLEILKKEFLKKKADYKKNVSEDLLCRYGGKEHLEAPPKQLLLAQPEQYIEYSKHGKIVKGVEQIVSRSKYEEDIHPNNHVSVWGSYWNSGKWGYACCHLFIKNSFCIGEAGKSINVESTLQASAKIAEEDPKTLVQLHKERKRKIENSDESEDEESTNEIRKKKLREALIKAKSEEDSANKQTKLDDRKRSYNSMYETKKLSEAEIEAYQLRKHRDDDPMQI